MCLVVCSKRLLHLTSVVWDCFQLNYTKVLFSIMLIDYYINNTLLCVVAGVKVNMQGSISLGKDVVDSLSYYLQQNVLSGRRSLIPAPIEDPITLTVRTALVCKELEFCDNEMQHFVNEYIIILAKAAENLLNTSDLHFSNERYKEELKYKLEYIRKILEEANTKSEEDVVEYQWIEAIKKINAKFQEMIDVFVSESTDNNYKSNIEAKKQFRHNVVIATTFIERKYQIKLCSDHGLCSKSHECTTALSKILFHLKAMSDDKIRVFIKNLYESLYNTSFYNHLSDTTAHQFQIILNDMAYANDTPTKDIMLSVQKTVEARLEILKENQAIQVSHDVLIAHGILSDVDHMYSHRTDPFIMFLNRFYDWMASNIEISKHIRAVISEITKEIWSHDEDLVNKLINEVKVFLEMTVDPDK